MRNSLAKNSIYNVIYQFLNIVFPFLTSVYVARLFGDSLVGEVAYSQNFIVYFVAIVSSGLPTYGIREIAKIRSDKASTNKLFSELFVLNGIFTSIALLLYFLFLAFFQFIIFDYKLAFIFSLQIFWNYINVDWFYTAYEEFKFITIRNAIVKCLLFFSVLLFVNELSDVYIYAFIICLGNGLNSICNIVYLKKYIRFTFTGLCCSVHIPIILLLAANVFLDSLYSKSDITMLGVMVDSSEVGIYSYAYKLPDLIMTVCVSLIYVFFPRLIQYYKEDYVKFSSLLDYGIKIVLFISIPAAVGYMLISSDLIYLLYGNEFLDSILVTKILSIMIIIKTLGNLLGYQLVFCTGDEKMRLPVYFAAAFINILLNFVMINFLGAAGAAISSVFTEILLNFSIILYEYKKVRFHFDYIFILKVIISTFAMVLLVLAVQMFIDYSVLRITLSVFLGVASYALINMILKNDIVYDFYKKIKK